MGPISFFSMWLSSVPNTIYWKDDPFPIWLPCQISVDYICMDLFLDSWFCSIGICVFLKIFGQYHAVLISVALQYSLKLGSVMPPALFFFLKIALAIQGILWFHTNFKIVVYISKKNAIAIFIGVILNPYIVLGSVDILIMLILLIH